MSAQSSEIRDSIGIDIAGASAWRATKSAEYPNDKRNLEAIAILDKIGSTVPAVPDDLLFRFQAAGWERGDLVPSELWSHALRHIGFGSPATTATDLITTFLSELPNLGH